MTDFHSHVLPRMDDGSGSVEESLAMLRASAAQGISRIAATPHFYPHENGIDRFLERREAAANRLRAAWELGLPELLLGAEVYYFEGLSRAEGLERLRIGGTGLLLLEMPFGSWGERAVREAAALSERDGFTVLLAHVERYLPFKNGGWIRELRQLGVKTQCNAGFFLHWQTRRRALRMLKRGEIDLLGSDCHNMGSRAPRLGEALAAFDEGQRQFFEQNSRLPVQKGTLSHPFQG